MAPVDLDIVIGVTLIIGGCIMNVFILELITKKDPGAGNIITLAQFSFIALEGLLKHVKSWSLPLPTLRKRSIPMYFYGLLTSLFFFLSVINNKALAFNISMPVHTVFRSSSLVASLLLGILFFGRNYGPEKIVGTLLVSMGITITTLADANEKRKLSVCSSCDGASPVTTAEAEAAEAAAEDFGWWLVGIGMLVMALLSSALLGHLQDYSYRTWRKDGLAKTVIAAESKFYSHALALPFFLLAYRDILEHAELWQRSTSLRDEAANWGVDVDAALPAAIANVPVLWFYLAGNVMTQYLCITGVYRLTAAASTLACTMTLTLRKFMSLVISVIYFANPFSYYHSLGTVFVFAGGSVYSGLLPLPAMLLNVLATPLKKEKQG